MEQPAHWGHHYRDHCPSGGHKLGRAHTAMENKETLHRLGAIKKAVCVKLKGRDKELVAYINQIEGLNVGNRSLPRAAPTTTTPGPRTVSDKRTSRRWVGRQNQITKQPGGPHQPEQCGRPGQVVMNHQEKQIRPIPIGPQRTSTVRTYMISVTSRLFVKTFSLCVHFNCRAFYLLWIVNNQDDRGGRRGVCG